jgi:Flp pilus assembly pilin Flp
MLSRVVMFQQRHQNLERGGTGVEVGMAAAVVAVIIVLFARGFGTEVSSLFETLAVSV